MNPAASVYGAAVAGRNAAFDHGWMRVGRLQAPVISVGNLAVGGRGKTPMVMALGRELRSRGIACDVLTRGYGRAGRDLALADGRDEAAAAGLSGGEDCGDEPRLLARELRCPVWVHADRLRAGREAERRFPGRTHLLDDGFQRRQLHRDFDLVMVTARDLEGERLLPVGRLREPPTALRRADAVVVIEEEAALTAERRAATRARAGRWTAAPVYFARKSARGGELAGARPLAFCGLAEPGSFWRTLEGMGVLAADRVAFRDHHRYTEADVERLAARARASGGAGCVTTAKDAMNLPPGAGERLAPLRVVELELTWLEAEAGLDALMEQIARALGARAGEKGGDGGRESEAANRRAGARCED